MPANAFGLLIKRLRIAQGMTLRELCQKYGFDPGNYSRLERGLFPPPQKHELLERYAAALGLSRGSDAWIELFDLAAAANGQLPKDLISDEELLDKLPALFRTLRGKPLDQQRLADFIEDARRS